MIAGEGPLMGRLQTQAESGHHGPSALSRPPAPCAIDVVVRIWDCGSAVLPSSFEGIPVALMEAMSYGIPIVSTAVGGIPELCDEGCGVLIPPEDYMALARAMEIAG